MNFGEDQRAALFEIVGLLAPDIDKARVRLADTLNDAAAGRLTPEGVLIDVLYEDGSGLTYCDWKSDPPEIREYLEELSAFPHGLTWEWYDWNDVEDWDPDDLHEFLWPLADRSLELGVALVGILVDGDGFTLGFLPADQLDRFGELAATAGSKIYVHRTGAPTP